MNQNKGLEWFFFLISSTENKRLSELENEVKNLKMEREKLKTKLQCFEENERLRKWKKSEAVENLMWKVEDCQDTYTYDTLHARTDGLQ